MISWRERALWGVGLIWCGIALWPVSFWHDVGEFEIADFQRGTDPVIKYSGGPVRDFIGSYTVIVRNAATHELMAEDASEPFPYLVDSTRPDPLRLSWWAPRKGEVISNLPAAIYTIQTCWTVHSPVWILPSKTGCTDVDIFEVTE